MAWCKVGLTASIVILSLLCGAVQATVYYVDYNGGSDDNAGTSPEAAFKHSPGDTAAKGAAKAAKVQPGDTVIFKGGVPYRSTVTIASSGAEGRPIVYDGSTAGTFGTGRAVIDGSEPITGWTRCASAEECGGNPHWRNIWYAAVPGKLTPFTVNLTEGDTSLAVAQDPNPADPYFEDVIDTWQPVVDPRPAAECLIRITKGKGMAENSGRPYILMVDGKSNTSAVVDPCVGAELTFELPEKVTATRLALAASTSYQMPKEVVFTADNKEVLRATIENKPGLQSFDLPGPTTFRTLVLKILTAYEHGSGIGAIVAVEALDAEGRNLMKAATDMTYADAGYFTQTDPHFWGGAYFVLYARPSLVYYQKVLGYDPEAHRLRFELTTAGQYPTQGEAIGKFSMMNCLGVLDRPGEFVLDERPREDSSLRVYVWPRGGEEGLKHIGRSVRSSGVIIHGADHVVLRGFVVEKQGASAGAGGIGGGGKESRHVTIEDNEIRLIRSDNSQAVGFSDVAHYAIRRNHIHHNRRTAGIRMRNSEECLIDNNRLHKNGRTGLSLITCRRVTVSRNTLTDHKGMHANGLTAYQGCHDITFLGNRVSGGSVCLTMEGGENMLIQGNIFDGGGSQMCVGVWNTDNLSNVRFYHNVFVRASRDVDWAAAIYWGGRNENAVGYVMRNNVLDGTSPNRKCIPVERSHNVYTRRRWCQADEQGWKPAEGEIVETDLSKLFVNPEAGDWRPKPGGPLIDAGANAGAAEDIVGTPVPQGAAPDIGAYEHKP